MLSWHSLAKMRTVGDDFKYLMQVCKQKNQNFIQNITTAIRQGHSWWRTPRPRRRSTVANSIDDGWNKFKATFSTSTNAPVAIETIASYDWDTDATISACMAWRMVSNAYCSCTDSTRAIAKGTCLYTSMTLKLLFFILPTTKKGALRRPSIYHFLRTRFSNNHFIVESALWSSNLTNVLTEIVHFVIQLHHPRSKSLQNISQTRQLRSWLASADI